MALKLYKHQEEAIEFILTQRNALLWHEVGLGKTLSAVTASRILLSRIRNHINPSVSSKSPKALVICPRGLVHQWRTEIGELAPDMSNSMVYVPFSQLHKARALCMYYDIRVIIVDESHMLKTMKTQRITRFRELLHHIANTAVKFAGGKFIFLTGTPIPNSGAEMYTTWAVLGAPTMQDAIERLDNSKRYMEWVSAFTYRDLKDIPKNKWSKKAKGWSAPKGVANEEQMNAVIAPFTHFRTADECLDLPEEQEVEIDLGIKDDELLEKADINKPAEYMALCERLARAKLPRAIEWIEEFYEATPDERLIVFCPYKWPLEEIQKHFGDKCTLIHGDKTLAERAKSVENYNSGVTPLLGGTYGALSTGYNLQAGCKTLYLGYPWSPKIVAQAKGRTKRTGQRKRTMHFFLMSGQNDKKILRSLRKKEEGITKIENKLRSSHEVAVMVAELI